MGSDAVVERGSESGAASSMLCSQQERPGGKMVPRLFEGGDGGDGEERNTDEAVLIKREHRSASVIAGGTGCSS